MDSSPTNGLFFIDLLLQFNIKLRRAAKPLGKGPPAHRVSLSTSWFLLDVGSLAPSTADYVLLTNYAAGKEGESPSTARIFRIIRVVRLLKLLRLLRSSRVFSRMLSRFPLPYKTLVMLRLSLWTLAAHWSACLLSISTTFSEQVSLTHGSLRMDTAGRCSPRAMAMESWFMSTSQRSCGSSTSTTQQAARSLCAPSVPTFEIYLASFEWGLLLISGVDVEPAMGLSRQCLQRRINCAARLGCARCFCSGRADLVLCDGRLRRGDRQYNPNAVKLRIQ